MPVVDNNVRWTRRRGGSEYTSVGSHVMCGAGVKIPLIDGQRLERHGLEVGSKCLLIPARWPIATREAWPTRRPTAPGPARRACGCWGGPCAIRALGAGHI